MKLQEIFEDQATTMQDMIVTRFELGHLTYEQAWEEIKKCSDPEELAYWEMELTSAEMNKESDEEAAMGVSPAFFSARRSEVLN